jgi:hypothetical protein
MQYITYWLATSSISIFSIVITNYIASFIRVNTTRYTFVLRKLKHA